MSKQALFSAAALIASAFAIQAVADPVIPAQVTSNLPPAVLAKIPTLPNLDGSIVHAPAPGPTSIPDDPISLAPVVDTAGPALAAQGNPADIGPVTNGAQRIGNAAIDAASKVADLALDPFGGAAPIGASNLAGTQGGSNNTTNVNANIVAAISTQDLSSITTDNGITANTITNGAVNIGSNAFSGFNGIGNFVLNTGNQNSLAGALSVNVVMAPPPAP